MRYAYAASNYYVRHILSGGLNAAGYILVYANFQRV